MSRAGLVALIAANLFIALQTFRHEWGYYETAGLLERGRHPQRVHVVRLLVVSMFLVRDFLLGREYDRLSIRCMGRGLNL